jgi:arogenate dehydrogenase (NADP+)
MISANLINSCLNNDNKEVVKLAQNLASSGFRDTSRVGGGNVELGLMMAQYNRGKILTCLKEYQQNLSTIIEDIEKEKWQELDKILTRTQQERSKFVDS